MARFTRWRWPARLRARMLCGRCISGALALFAVVAVHRIVALVALASFVALVACCGRVVKPLVHCPCVALPSCLSLVARRPCPPSLSSCRFVVASPSCSLFVCSWSRSWSWTFAARGPSPCWCGRGRGRDGRSAHPPVGRPRSSLSSSQLSICFLACLVSPSPLLR